MATAVDTYIDFEDSTDGTTLTTTILGKGTHGSAGTWTYSGDDFFVATAGELNLGREFLCSSATYGDASSSRGARFNLTNGTEYIKNVAAASHTNMSVGFAFKTNLTYLNYNFYTPFVILNFAESRYAGLSINNNGSGHYHFRIEVDGSAYNLTPDYNFLASTWYWMTCKFAGGEPAGYLSIYDTATWGLLASGSNAMGGTSDAQIVKFGMPGGGPPSGNFDFYFDDMVFDWTNAAYPLLPEASGAASVPSRLANATPLKSLINGGLLRTSLAQGAWRRAHGVWRRASNLVVPGLSVRPRFALGAVR